MDGRHRLPAADMRISRVSPGWSLMDLPDECLIAIASSPNMTGGDRCSLSMSCKKLKHLLDGFPKEIDAVSALSLFGYFGCKRLGMPLVEGVTAILAATEDFEGLITAADDGCPVGSGVAAQGACLGNMDLLVWAWRRGAEINRTVAEKAGTSPPHMIQWLALQGCPLQYAIEGAAIADNVEGIRQIAAFSDRFAFTFWIDAYKTACSHESYKTITYIREKFDLLAV